jgi:Cof subfamily protein (haloacid dehalogenase superfamily)
MTKIALVVSDVDGTLLTKNKVLTEKAAAAARRLEDSGVGFTVTSSRPTIGMRFLVEPLRLTLPFGSFNGSSICHPDLKPIEQHLIPPAAAKRTIEVLKQFGVDIWLFTNELWMIENPAGTYVAWEQRTIKSDPTIVRDFTPYLNSVCKIVGASDEPELLKRCEAAMREALGADATAARSQTYYLDITPPGHDKGTFVEAMAERLGIATAAIATIGDMRNDIPMFRKSGMSIAMGNATDEIKQLATHVTTSNEDEGFAGAIEIILKNNAAAT